MFVANETLLPQFDKTLSILQISDLKHNFVPVSLLVYLQKFFWETAYGASIFNRTLFVHFLRKHRGYSIRSIGEPNVQSISNISIGCLGETITENERTVEFPILEALPAEILVDIRCLAKKNRKGQERREVAARAERVTEPPFLPTV